MSFTRDQAYAALASLNPAQVFLDSYRHPKLPENLEIYFGPPEEFFIAADTQDRYTGGRLIPILDDGNFGLVTYLDPDSRELIQMDVESPDEDRTIFRHWQQYLADLIVTIGESLASDDHLRRIADRIGFGHVEELFDYYQRTEDLEGDEWWQARRQFPASIVAR